MHGNRSCFNAASLFTFLIYLLISPLVAEAVVDFPASVVDVEATARGATVAAKAADLVVRNHPEHLPAGPFVSIVPATHETVNFSPNVAAVGGLQAMTVVAVNGDVDPERRDRLWMRAAGGNGGATEPLARWGPMGYVGTTATAREGEEERRGGGRSEAKKKGVKRTEKKKNVWAPMGAISVGTKSEKTSGNKKKVWAPMGMNVGDGSRSGSGRRGSKVALYAPMAKDD
ncbi:hypothetical protein DFJ73DRAFT_759407 [Zopfochytrium polystomum]|nr:hypothetical protein DFJ73DRAFT_759407 [Zopfochytrium polystomum]